MSGIEPVGAASRFPSRQTTEFFAWNGLPQYRDLRAGIWIWDASSVRGFVMLLARV
jgi:hypothetical protein